MSIEVLIQHRKTILKSGEKEMNAKGFVVDVADGVHWSEHTFFSNISEVVDFCFTKYPSGIYYLNTNEGVYLKFWELYTKKQGNSTVSLSEE